MKDSRHVASNTNTYASPKQIAIGGNSIVFYYVSEKKESRNY